VSQARRVDVFTWRAPNVCLASHLDVDHVAAGQLEEIPTVRRSPLPKWVQEQHRSFSGTLVIWSKCDRLANRRLSTIARKLHEPLGRMFRYFIWKGVKIWVNDQPVSAVDPLFLHASTLLSGAQLFGEPLIFEVRVPGTPGKTSMIRVRFSELPVEKWHDLPLEEKRRHRIVDGAGLSILRANREVDYGWWFFGAKRRENYDSWWRGELSFGPELDELFSITHSKQGINPTQELRDILTPDLEAVARQLNSRVQTAFASVKESAPAPGPSSSPSPSPASLPTPAARRPESQGSADGKAGSTRQPNHGNNSEDRPEYRVAVERFKSDAFFEVRAAAGQWCLVLNSKHPFFKLVYEPLRGRGRRHLEQLLIAHARAEVEGRTAKRTDPASLRAAWASQLAELLEGEA
jgi:hypothetical protein